MIKIADVHYSKEGCKKRIEVTYRPEPTLASPTATIDAGAAAGAAKSTTGLAVRTRRSQLGNRVQLRCRWGSAR